MKYPIRAILSALCILCAVPGIAKAAVSVKVVTTQAIFADLVRQVGGDRVEVHAIAPPRFNVHFIQPKPSDVRKVAKADLYVNAGLDLEAWSDPLLEAAGKPDLFRGGPRNLDLSKGIDLLKVSDHAPSRSEGDIHLFGNPHYHMDPRNGGALVRAISEKLKEIDPEGASEYEAAASSFLGRLETKIAEWKRQCSHCEGQEVVSYHDDIEYLAVFLGMNAHMFLEPKPGIPPTAKHLAALEEDARSHGVKAVIQSTYYDRSTADHIAEKIGARVVLIAQNAGELPDTGTYLGFFDANVRLISEALK